MIAFIDEHRGYYGIELICRVPPIDPYTYHEHVAQRSDPSRLPIRAQRDEALKPEVMPALAENFSIYGVRKVWQQMQREGFDVARCALQRLVREPNLRKGLEPTFEDTVDLGRFASISTGADAQARAWCASGCRSQSGGRHPGLFVLLHWEARSLGCLLSPTLT